jgi:L-fuculose-phosphate aldolase
MSDNLIKFERQKKEVASFMKRLYLRGLTSVSGGNTSLRLDDNLFCITSSSTDKSLLTEADIGVVTMKGENLTPHLKLSIESKLHHLILLKREDVKAVIHAHPIYTTALSATSCPININLSGEFKSLLKTIVKVPYKTMGSVELAESVSDALLESDVAVMENHGIVAVGKTLFEAFEKIEAAENCAKMTFVTENLTRWKINEIF